jgi:hypothetical protein
MPNAPSSKSLVAMVALNRPVLPKWPSVLSSLRARYAVCPTPREASENDNTITCWLGDDMVAVSLMPAPIPWSDLEGPCATAWWWPEATDRMRKHTSHVIVALMGETGELLERHIRLTHLVAAVAANTDAAGIYWGSGTVVHDPQAFQVQSANLAPDNLEPQLWVDMRLEQNDDNSYRYFTTGMQAFGCPELEIRKSQRRPDEILDFGYAIVNYILTSGVTIKDGETIGRSADEKIKARHKPSMWDKNRTILDLAFA